MTQSVNPSHAPAPHPVHTRHRYYGKVRLFAAIPLPPPAVDRLSALRLRLAAPGDGLRWTAPEQWHITLQFFGDLDEQQIGLLKRDFRAIRLPEATVRLEALGRFPSKGILFAAAERSSSFLALYEAFKSGVGSWKPASVSSLPFHPHVTLARSKGRVGGKTLEKLSFPALPQYGAAVSWQTGKSALYESCLGPNGAQYRLLAETSAVDAPAPTA